jgi:CspA family cold shock protein
VPVCKTKSFNVSKGDGFVGRGDGDGLYAHYSSIQMDGFTALREGDGVELAIMNDGKGPKGDNVAVIKRTEQSPGP